MVHLPQNGRKLAHDSQISPKKLRQRVSGKVVLIVYGAFLATTRLIKPLIDAGARVVLLCQPDVPATVIRLQTEIGNDRWQVLNGDLRQPDFLMRIRQEIGTPDIFLDLRSKTAVPAPYYLPDKLNVMLTFLKEEEFTDYADRDE